MLAFVSLPNKIRNMRNISRTIRAFCALISIVVSSSAFASATPFSLDADPNYTFPGSTQPDTAAMATAINARLGKPVTIVSSLANENTELQQTLGDHDVAPYYVYGPSANGVIKNLNLNSSVLSGILSAQLRYAGTDSVGGVALNRWVLRTFTQTQFNDILVRWVSFQGSPSSYVAAWSFHRISASRAIGGTLANLSSRALVLTGDNVAIAGFIINGSGTKQVLIRGIGPSVLGLTLADPTLELRDGAGTLLLSNNDWRETQETQIQATGLQPGNDRESAILATLSPGNYSAVFAGNKDGTGLGVVEIYGLSGSAQLANISTRASVGTGNNVLIAGMIVQAVTSGPKVAIRALGPSLTQYGISGAMQDPTLELKDSNGASMATNNNWGEVAQQAAEIQAAGMAPSDYRESVILANLAPGNYSAVLQGASGTTGVATVEVYKIY